ncbi:MAG: precorrin-2 C(20)-methyltransferase [Caldimicrobium sp.]
MKLYVIGVGPGDSELITLKGLKILKKTPLIFYPTGGKETLALSIIKDLIPLEEKVLIELYFPMKKEGDLSSHWKTLAEIIKKHISEKKEGVFITLGDPAFYSTFFYLKPYLEEMKIETEIIPGINSFSAASARLGIPLALSKEEIVITGAESFLKNSEKYLFYHTIILMKCHRYLREIGDFAKNYGFSVFVGKRVGQKGEKLWYNLSEVKEDDLDYFTLIILKKTLK